VTNSIEIKLGPWDEMADLFSWDASSGIDLRDLIAHGINQTMQRDGLLGSWADVYHDAGDTLSVKISAPFEQVKRYAKIIPAFIAAGRVGYGAYMQHRATILQGKLIFYLPVGLPMLATKSVQLLHYPPYEARTYSDYLYSPTNRRWESLLGYNEYMQSGVTLLERICDAVPLAGPGSDATVINEVESYFIPYGKAMLAALLDQSGERTQPVVAYGGPAHAWLKTAFPTQIKRTPTLFSVLVLKVGNGEATTPVLCANHPSEFLFFNEPHYKDDEHSPPTLVPGKASAPGKDGRKKIDPKKWAFDIMTQDLIAARWQAYMAEHWDADPVKVLAEAKQHWESDPDRVREIVAAQEEEFGFAKESPTMRNPTAGKIVSGDEADREVPLVHAQDDRLATDDAKTVTQPSRKPSLRR
jgi:hypothetical protein